VEINIKSVSKKKKNQDISIIIDEPVIVKIGELADKEGIQVYAVGGFVRDYFLGNIGNDFDFTVVGDAIEFAEKTARIFNSKPVIYKKFRTAMVPIGDYKIEFVGTRKEEYLTNSRKPIVTEGTLEDDLSRRDFTINAMAASVNKSQLGKVVDIFNGLSDLKDGILRTPLEPETTFSDDPLRMMRAARFASRLGFRIEENCTTSIKNMADRISIISQERITDEFLKILSSPQPSYGLNILFETGLLKLIFPELHRMHGNNQVEENGKVYAHKDILFHSFKVLDNISNVTDNVWLRFAALVHDIAKPITRKIIPGTGWSFHGHEDLGAKHMERIFRRMKLPLDMLPYVEKLVRLHQRPMVLVSEGVTDSAIRRLAFQAGNALEDLFVLCRSDITTNNPRLSKKYLSNYEKVAAKVLDVQEKDKLREFQSPVRGEEIMSLCNLQPSPIVGFIKTAIEEAILEGYIPNDYDAAKDYFFANKDKWLEEAKLQKNQKNNRKAK
jgi:poly(A) polymerase